MRKQKFVVQSNKIDPNESQSSMHTLLHQDSIDRLGSNNLCRRSHQVNKSMIIPSNRRGFTDNSEFN